MEPSIHPLLTFAVPFLGLCSGTRNFFRKNGNLSVRNSPTPYGVCAGSGYHGWLEAHVVTVGEKIGKDHLTYAQGASAELMAMATIGVADHFGLPVSTTHVLSSGIAGAMTANDSGIQKETVRNLVIAWVLMLSVCIFLGALTFSAGLFVVFNILGMK